VSEPEKVAARMMDLWAEDPFLKTVKLDSTWPLCPFRDEQRCRAAARKTMRVAHEALTCPAETKNGTRVGAPKNCPLRFGKIEVKGV